MSCLQDGPCLDRNPAVKLGYDKNGVYICGGHIGDDNPHTVPGVSHDCFAVPPEEVKAIAQGTAPIHLNRGHNLPLDIVPAIDHDRSKARNRPGILCQQELRPRGAVRLSALRQFLVPLDREHVHMERRYRRL